MKRKIIHYTDNSGRLHCDNPACGYDLPEPLEFSEALIGYHCPKCGSDMLTRADYEAAVKMRAALMRTIDFLNRWFGWLGTKEPPPNKGRAMSIRCHDGATIIQAETMQ